MVASDTFLRQTMGMTFLCQHLYSVRPVKRYTCQALLRNGSVALPLQARLTSTTDHDSNDKVHSTVVSEFLVFDCMGNTTIYWNTD